ncbi:hypothetical protein CONCODRAFT_67845 [Conidiobolus coronatus NRRL 28638]|uniref:Uncharacterized protein n=1 Tax=Conidiobolus coronatus (strain ATCC 28846 / CBS 209.66 / NRRL 28638) TaxID=796925 RepID=A0A137PGE6_CONC2|nr:hypothetical protein CONCODRAFT_67845 [Conidiobolus coronatus NRRL 28638]|eukprot:KXN74079.1 hypothetical protein CONCODRAFT_67845 [Conidiobolus coronatus NRRL 28638]
MLLSLLNDDVQLEDELSNFYRIYYLKSTNLLLDQELALINENNLNQNNTCCDYPVFYATEQLIKCSLNHLCNTNFQPINYEYDYSNAQNLDCIKGYDPDQPINCFSGPYSNDPFQIINYEYDCINTMDSAINNNSLFNPFENIFECGKLNLSIAGQQDENKLYFKNSNNKREYKEISIGDFPTPFEVEMVRKGYSKCVVNNGDAYSPHWIIYHNGDKEGLCQICFENKVEETFKLKSSSYW